MSTALITWIGSSWMSAAIRRRSSSWAVSSSCARSRRCADHPPHLLEARAELLLGLLLGGDVDHHASPVQDGAILRLHRHRLVADPHLPPVFREDPILGQEALPSGVRGSVLFDRALPILRVQGAEPEFGVPHPLLDAVAEQVDDLRARVEVGRQLIRPVDVEDRRRALDQRPVRLGMQLLARPSRHRVTPAR